MVICDDKQFVFFLSEWKHVEKFDWMYQGYGWFISFIFAGFQIEIICVHTQSWSNGVNGY